MRGHAGTPVPKRDIELKSSGCGPVVAYYLSEEELKRMREKEGPACGLTKRDLLEAVAAGETLSSIERAWGMKYNTIHNWVKKWDLKGITPDKAREHLEQMEAEHPEIGQTQSVEQGAVIERLQLEVTDLEQKIAAFEKERESERAENERLLKELDEKQKLIDQMQEPQQPVKTVAMEMLDPVNRPAHYTAGKVECIDAIDSATIGLTGGQAYSTGAAIKYLWRWSRKGGVEDLRKARWYIDRLIAELEVEAG